MVDLTTPVEAEEGSIRTVEGEDFLTMLYVKSATKLVTPLQLVGIEPTFSTHLNHRSRLHCFLLKPILLFPLKMVGYSILGLQHIYLIAWLLL